MKSPHEDRGPDALHIAAFLDGEYDGRPELVERRQRIREWLLDHPEAGAAALAQRRLARLMAATAPPEPSEVAWDRVFARLDQAPAPAAPAAGRSWLPRAGAAAAALLTAAAAGWLALFLGQQPPPAPVQEAPAPVAKRVEPAPRVEPPAPKAPEWEVFPVATAAEIEILRIGGADTRTLVVGELPVIGPLEPTRPGEVVLTRADAEVRLDVRGWMWMREFVEDDPQ
jgi:hypothetical protein